MTEKEKLQEGAFVSSLKRNNAKIKQDRAASISEDAELAYRRSVEDLAMSVKRMKRKQENMLDLSPTNSTSLMIAADFDCAEYVKLDTQLGVDIYKTEQVLKVAKARLDYLFGSENKETVVNVEEIKEGV